MTGLRGLDSDIGRLQIADLTNHDDVRILPQEGAQRHGEAETGALVDVDLVDARQIDFGRVLGRGDVDAGFVEEVQEGVERDGLSRTGRASHQYHAVGALDGVEQQCLLLGLVAERINAELRLAAVKNTHDDLFAEQRW